MRSLQSAYTILPISFSWFFPFSMNFSRFVLGLDFIAVGHTAGPDAVSPKITYSKALLHGQPDLDEVFKWVLDIISIVSKLCRIDSGNHLLIGC